MIISRQTGKRMLPLSGQLKPFRGSTLEERGYGKYTKEDYSGLDRLRLLATDGRYIILGGFSGSSVYKNLSSGAPNNTLGSPDDGIGVIDAEDFISGKDMEIRQIYER